MRRFIELNFIIIIIIYVIMILNVYNIKIKYLF